MHAYFSIFYIFIFLFFIYIFYFFRAGLGPASPARSLAHASDPAGPSQQEARVDWLHTCIMHSAKVINLPSHRATLHSKRMYKNESKMAYLFSGDGGDGGSALPFVCSQPSLLLSFASVPAVPLLLCPLFLFSFCFSLLSQSLWWSTEDGAGFSFQNWVWVLCCVCADVRLFLIHYTLSLWFFLLAPLCFFFLFSSFCSLFLFSLRPPWFCFCLPPGSVTPLFFSFLSCFWFAGGDQEDGDVNRWFSGFRFFCSSVFFVPFFSSFREVAFAQLL